MAKQTVSTKTKTTTTTTKTRTKKTGSGTSYKTCSTCGGTGRVKK